MIRRYLKPTFNFWQITLEDFKSRVKFAKVQKKENFSYSISITQPIIHNNTSANKVINISIAVQKIEKIVIYPDEIFSFWRVVGRATRFKGYKKGHNLINGIMKNDYGGGLCHVSSMIYYISLIAGLKIVERHAHSIDFQASSVRYAPLGSDATIAFGYKDLRIQNNLNTPISFSFEVSHESFTVKLLSKNKIEKKEVTFYTVHSDHTRAVIKTIQDKKCIYEDNYLRSK